MKKFVSVLVLFLFSSLLLEAGKLEDFSEEYAFLRKNWSVYNSKKRRSNREQELMLFRKRISLASDSAFEIQIAAEKCGIKGITIGDDFQEAVSGLRVMGGKTTRENFGVRSQAMTRIDQQLALLKQLKFSVEEGTFSKQEYSGTNDMDALKQLEKMMNTLLKAAIGKNNFVSSSYIANLKKGEFDDFRKLASEISLAAEKQKRKLPSTCNLEDHADLFLRDLAELYRLRSETKSSRNRRNFEHTVDPGKLKSITGKLKFDVEQLRQDITDLRQSGFVMEKINPAPYDAARSSMESISPERNLLVNEKSSAKVQSRSGMISELDVLKNKVYHSESRLNGVSQNLYDRYRKLLTIRQADDLDREYRKALDLGYPSALARGNAVRKIHGKYTGKNNACTEDELQAILRQAVP